MDDSSISFRTFLHVYAFLPFQKEYNAYFEWKQNHQIYIWQSFCQLCQMISDPNIPRKTVPDAYEWWYHRDNGALTCTNGSDRPYYKGIS